MSLDEYMEKQIRANGHQAAEENKGERRAVLAAGLEWLTRTEQPEGTILSHHGFSIHAKGNRVIQFTPDHGGAVCRLSVSVAKEDRDIDTMELRNPLEEGESAAILADLEALGASVHATWGARGEESGDGTAFFSVALDDAPSPTLFAAIERYRAGCPDHPSKGVFCDCGWWQQGNRLLVPPAETAVFA